MKDIDSRIAILDSRRGKIPVPSENMEWKLEKGSELEENLETRSLDPSTNTESAALEDYQFEAKSEAKDESYELSIPHNSTYIHPIYQTPSTHTTMKEVEEVHDSIKEKEAEEKPEEEMWLEEFYNVPMPTSTPIIVQENFVAKLPAAITTQKVFDKMTVRTFSFFVALCVKFGEPIYKFVEEKEMKNNSFVAQQVSFGFELGVGFGNLNYSNYKLSNGAALVQSVLVSVLGGSTRCAQSIGWRVMFNSKCRNYIVVFGIYDGCNGPGTIFSWQEFFGLNGYESNPHDHLFAFDWKIFCLWLLVIMLKTNSMWLEHLPLGGCYILSIDKCLTPVKWSLDLYILMYLHWLVQRPVLDHRNLCLATSLLVCAIGTGYKGLVSQIAKMFLETNGLVVLCHCVGIALWKQLKIGKTEITEGIVNGIRDNFWQFDPGILDDLISTTDYELGGSAMALFYRVGGGIYTTPADIGLNFAGHNVGEIVGMRVGLFGSSADGGLVSSFLMTLDFKDMTCFVLSNFVGILVGLIITLFYIDVFQSKVATEISSSLRKPITISIVFMIVGIASITWTCLLFKFVIRAGGLFYPIPP